MRAAIFVDFFSFHSALIYYANIDYTIQGWQVCPFGFV